MNAVIQASSSSLLSKVVPTFLDAGYAEAIEKGLATKDVVVVTGVPSLARTAAIATVMASTCGALVSPDLVGGVLVLTASRFAAINAAHILAAIDGSDIGRTVGYAMSRRSGTTTDHDVRTYTKETPIVFMPYGYALANKAIHSYRFIILDETHLNSVDMAAAKAILTHRLRESAIDYDVKDRPMVISLNGAVGDAGEASFWSSSETATTSWIQFEDPALDPCNFTEVDNTGTDHEQKLVDVAVHAIMSHRPEGIMVFVDTAQAATRVAEEIRRKSVYYRVLPEIVTLHSDSTINQLEQAIRRPAPGTTKVICGTSVLESGIEVPWATVGISSGVGRELRVSPETGSVRGAAATLSQSRIHLQRWQINRTGLGSFTLVSPTRMVNRPMREPRDLDRLPPTRVALQCIQAGLSPSAISDTFFSGEAILELQQRGFITHTMSLTDRGRLVLHGGVGLSTAIMLQEADLLGVLPQMIPIAAAHEVGGIRRDPKKSFGFYNESDLIDQGMAFCKAHMTMWDAGIGDIDRRRQVLYNNNVAYYRFSEAVSVAANLEGLFNQTSNLHLYELVPQKSSMHGDDATKILRLLRQCILAAFLDTGLYATTNAGDSVIGRKINHLCGVNKYRMVHGSVVNRIAMPWTTSFATATIMQIRRAEHPAFDVMSNITVHSEEELIEFIGRHLGRYEVKVSRGVTVYSTTTFRPIFHLDLTEKFNNWKWLVRGEDSKRTEIRKKVEKVTQISPAKSDADVKKDTPRPVQQDNVQSDTTPDDDGLTPAQRLAKAWNSKHR